MNSWAKTPIAESMNRFTEGKVGDVLELAGKALPCSVVSVSGPIVTVKFEINSGFTIPNVSVPIFGSEYIRLPIQPKCKGVVFAIDVYLGGVSGQGGGVADLSRKGNLSTLVFFPIGNTSFSPTDNPNALVMYGPEGVVVRTLDGSSTVVVGQSGVVVRSSKVVVQNSSVIVEDGDVMADGISLKTHVHTGVEAGSGVSGPPVP